MKKRNPKNELIHKFEKMLELGESFFFDLNEYIDIIEHYLFYGNYSMARKSIQTAAQQFPNNSELLLYNAELLTLEGNYKQALETIQKLYEMEPEQIEVPLLEADIYSRNHQHEEAVKSLYKALKINPEDTEILDLLTIEYLYMDNYSDALKSALKSLRLEPENQAALYNAITCFDFLDMPEKGLVFLKKYVDKEPMSEIGWNLLAKKYIDKKEYSKALKALNFSIAIDDKFLGAYYDKAYVLNKLGKYQESIKFYKLTLAIADPTAFAYYHIAKNYELNKEESKALIYYEKAIYEDPAHYKSWYRLVALLNKLGKPEQALIKSQEAVQTAPTQELYEQLAHILIHFNRTGEAIKAFEDSIKMGIMKIEIVLKLADLYLQHGEKEKFRDLLLKANRQFPDSKEIKNKMKNNLQ